MKSCKRRSSFAPDDKIFELFKKFDKFEFYKVLIYDRMILIIKKSC